ncbi:MAG: hypothetical protein FWH53_04565 [Leptospirales bacterium]|nr:hypothetical protein [Leptospirales bacterium]
MKTKIIILSILSIFLAFIMTGCYDSSKEKEATVVFNFGGGNQDNYSASSLTSWPPKDIELHSLRYEINFLSFSDTKLSFDASGSGPFTYTISPGDYIIEVIAYTSDGECAYSSKGITLSPGQNYVPITMQRSGKYEAYINITPPEASITKGGNQTFLVSPSHGLSIGDTFTDSYIWSVEGKTSGNTKFNPESTGSTANLVVGSDETASTLIVKAELASNRSRYVTATVAITEVIVIDAQTPIITTQPQDANCLVGSAIALTVAASITDGGTPSYQWYSNSTNSNSGGTEIPGETKTGYTPDTTTPGIYYYYVMVTNTNNSVNGNTTATVPSNFVTVEVELPPLSGTVIIKPNSNPDSLTGVYWEGQQMEADIGALSGTGTITCIWKRGTTEIATTNAPFYILTTADCHEEITVTVSRDDCSGTITSDPVKVYKSISTLTELDSVVRAKLNGNYVLTNTSPITISAVTWAPIGDGNTPFTGIFDGNGKTITFPSGSGFDPVFARNEGSGNDIYCAGLFGVIGSGGEVKNLSLTGDVSATFNDYWGECGVVAGENCGAIYNVSTSVNITGANSGGGLFIGSIAGVNNESGSNPGTIRNCYSTGAISGSGDSSNSVGAGGILGRHQAVVDEVKYCWAEGTVFADRGSPAMAAGIVASYGAPGIITNCVALHTNVVGDSYYSARILQGSNEGLSDNYANSAMVDSTLSGTTFTTDLGSNMSNGESVSIASTEITDGSWWTGNTGPKWTTVGTGAVWGGNNENMPWKWDSLNSRPILWFETTLNQ